MLLPNSLQRRIQNLVKHLKWSVLGNSERLKAVNYFRKTLNFRCLTGFWIRLYPSLLDYMFLKYYLISRFVRTSVSNVIESVLKMIFINMTTVCERILLLIEVLKMYFPIVLTSLFLIYYGGKKIFFHWHLWNMAYYIYLHETSM